MVASKEPRFDEVSHELEPHKRLGADETTMILRDAIQFLRGVLEQSVMISRGAIQFLHGVLGRKGTNSENDNLNSVFFVRSGCEYYAVARFAMYGQLSYVCGNLFHHAVEMLLKARLAKHGRDLDERKDMGHSLKKLWRAYKAGHSSADLERHTKTINRLDKYEDIRYPNHGFYWRVHGMVGRTRQDEDVWRPEGPEAVSAMRGGSAALYGSAGAEAAISEGHRGRPPKQPQSPQDRP